MRHSCRLFLLIVRQVTVASQLVVFLSQVRYVLRELVFDAVELFFCVLAFFNADSSVDTQKRILTLPVPVHGIVINLLITDLDQLSFFSLIALLHPFLIRLLDFVESLYQLHTLLF